MKSDATQPTIQAGCDVAEDFSNLNRCPSWGALSNYLKILRQFNLATLLGHITGHIFCHIWRKWKTLFENADIYIRSPILTDYLKYTSDKRNDY